MMAAADTFFEEAGYCIGGPMICGMVDDLVERLRSKPVDQLWFIARDGKIFHEVWQRRVPADLQDLATHYVLLSRRALQVASFAGFDKETLEFMGSRVRGLRPSQIRNALGLTVEGNAGRDTEIPNGQLNDFMLGLEAELMVRAQAERKGLVRYLAGLCGPQASRLAMVDIGWHGTLQRLLRKFLSESLDRSIHLDGYYLALLSGESGSASEAQTGLFCDHRISPERCPMFSLLVYLMECFTGTVDPSLLNFGMDESGNPTPRFSAFPISEGQANAYKAMRHGILRFASVRRDPVSIAEAARPLLKLGYTPSPQERQWFGRLQIGHFGDARLQPLLPYQPLWRTVLWPPSLTRAVRGALWLPALWEELNPLERWLAGHFCPAACEKLFQGKAARRLWEFELEKHM